MDINQMVQDLMRAERMPMDRMKQDQQIIEWRMEEYRNINRKLDQFRTNIFDNVLRQSRMLANKATSSNDRFVTATATASANPGSFRITEVKKLATAASNSSQDSISGENKLELTKSMQTQSFSDDGFWKQGIVNKKEVTVSTQTRNVSIDGGIQDPGEAIVRVNGVSFDVITEGEPEENQVLITEDGALEFGRNLRARDKVEVTFFTDEAQKNFSINENRLNVRLDHRGIYFDESEVDSLRVEITNGDTTTTSLTVVTDLEDLEPGKVFVNLQTGEMRFAEGTEGEVNVTYKQNFTSSSITSFNASGQPVTDNFVFTGDQTMNEVVRQMNASNTGINVFYDEFADKISVIRSETGIYNTSGEEILFEGDFFTKGLKLDSDNEREATNAAFTINGLETQRQSNTFTMNGITMTLRDTFEAGTNTITIGASKNVDSIMDTIKGFVDEYNELVDLVNGKLREDFHRDFRPLTEEQRDAMSDREIERWEEKSMSGMLRNDRTLRNGFDRFRMDMYSPVNIGFDSDYTQLSAIGITTTSNHRDGGKLQIDEDKLRAAIENDPEAVYRIFAGDGTTHGEKGVARRIRDSAESLIQQVSQRAGGLRGRNMNHQFTLGRELNQLDSRISNFERKMERVEQRYWAQFTAMEKAVAQANSQGEALWAQLYGGGF
nr:flagellar filament capping protein FliD [Bacillus alkalicola]